MLPSAATDSICTSLTTGTICSATAPADPSTRSVPLTAASGTVTVAWLPSPLTAVVATTASLRLPAASTVLKTTRVALPKPLPTSVICLAQVCRSDRTIGRRAAAGRRLDGREAHAESSAGAAGGGDAHRPCRGKLGQAEAQAAIAAAAVADVEAAAARAVGHHLATQFNTDRALGKAAALDRERAADEVAGAHGQAADGGHDLQQQAAGIRAAAATCRWWRCRAR